MKILKKILPLASIASVAAVAAPLATSCSAGTNAGSYTFSYDVEDTAGVTKYEPKFVPAPQQGQEMDPFDFINLYYSKLDENHSLFADDMSCGLYAALSQLLKGSTPIKTLNGTFKVNILSLKPFEREIMENKTTLREISFSVEYDVDVTIVEKKSNDEEVEHNAKLKQIIKVEDVMIAPMTQSNVNALFILPKKTQSFKKPDWSLDKDWKVSITSQSNVDGALDKQNFEWNYKNARDPMNYRSPFNPFEITDLRLYDAKLENSLIGSFMQFASTMVDEAGNPVSSNHYLSKNKSGGL